MNKYLQIRYLEEGGYGQVYLAISSNGKHVVLKKAHYNKIVELKNEAALLGKINHNNIVALIDKTDE